MNATTLKITTFVKGVWCGEADSAVVASLPSHLHLELVLTQSVTLRRTREQHGEPGVLSSSWASSDDVWIKMLNKELKYVHDKSYLQRHPKLQPKMRAILLDWLLEVRTGNISLFKNQKNKRIKLFNSRICVQVSEVYSLHRQTAYLAQDYFDRFMLTEEDVSKEYLQLLGITALFIASKIEVSPSSASTER